MNSLNDLKYSHLVSLIAHVGEYAILSASTVVGTNNARELEKEFRERAEKALDLLDGE